MRSSWVFSLRLAVNAFPCLRMLHLDLGYFYFFWLPKGGNSQEFVTVIAMNLLENFRIICSAALKEVALQIYLCLKAKCLQGITLTRA